MKIPVFPATLAVTGLVGLFAGMLIASAPVAAETRPVVATAKKIPAASNWTSTVSRGGDGTYTIGNPNAPVKLTEYISYTCPHCAHFSQESDAPLMQGAIPQGQVSLRVSNILRNIIDVTVASLLSCTDTKGFFARHRQVLATQDTWLGRADKLSDAQQERWGKGAISDRTKAVAQDLGLFDMAKGWGLGAAAANKCLSDPAVLAMLKAQHDAGIDTGLNGTPSFAINGELVEGVNGWASLSETLKTRITAAHSGSI